MLSDPAVKQIIMDLNSQMRFVIEDLDDTHLFVGDKILSNKCNKCIDATMVETIKERLDDILEENTYRVSDL